MAEVIQCPACLQWLNLEMHEAEIVSEIWEGILLYGCEKCGAIFDELGNVIEPGGGTAVNDEAVKLVWRMVLATMAGRKERTWELYEKYLRYTRLYVTIGEYIEWRRELEGKRKRTA